MVHTNHRFFNLFTLALLLNPKKSQTLLQSPEKYPRLFSHYTEVQKQYVGLTNANVSDYVENLEDFDELKKAFLSYKRLVLDSKNRDKHALLRSIKEIMKAKGITNYRIYTDLLLNPGNTNDFIKNEVLEKMSIRNVQMIMEYCKNYSLK